MTKYPIPQILGLETNRAMNEFLNKLRNFKQGMNLQIVARVLVWTLLCLAAGLHAYFLLWLNLPAQSSTLVYLNYALKALMAVIPLILLYRGIRGFFDARGVARFLDMQTDHADDLYQNLYELKLQKESSPSWMPWLDRLKRVSRLPNTAFPSSLSPISGSSYSSC